MFADTGTDQSQVRVGAECNTSAERLRHQYNADMVGLSRKQAQTTLDYEFCEFSGNN